jgi:DNA-binding NarL/FixJ family response regulator
MQMVRIVTADDHPIFRDGLRRLLESQNGFQVVGEAGSASEAVRLVANLAPDVILLDLAMPDASGLDVLRALHASGATVRPVVLTATVDRPQILEALRLGARGIVLKESATALLYKCIHSVMAGEYWVGHDRMSLLVDALRQAGTPPVAPADTLTRRELHIIAAIVEGATNKEISAKLGLSEQTVKNHMSHIFDKLGVSNRLELALFAIHHKLLDRAR